MHRSCSGCSINLIKTYIELLPPSKSPVTLIIAKKAQSIKFIAMLIDNKNLLLCWWTTKIHCYVGGQQKSIAMLVDNKEEVEQYSELCLLAH